jgi:hypothetical protein
MYFLFRDVWQFRSTLRHLLDYSSSFKQLGHLPKIDSQFFINFFAFSGAWKGAAVLLTIHHRSRSWDKLILFI